MIVHATAVLTAGAAFAEDFGNVGTLMPRETVVPAVVANEGLSFGGHNDLAGPTVRAITSTLGPGAEIGYRMSDRFGLRMPFGSGKVSFDNTFADYDVSGDMKLGGVGMLLDYHPYEGGFYMSGGVFKTSYSFLGSTALDIAETSQDVTLSVRQRREISPALSLGWDVRIGDFASLSTNLGAIFGTGFDAIATGSSPGVLQPSVDAGISDFRRSVGDIRVLPYLNVGVGFRF